MFRTLLTAAALVSTVAIGVAPAEAHYHGGYYGHGGGYGHGYYGHGGYGHGGYGRGGYGGRGYYDGRCRNSGTGGAILGAVGGGLLGNSIAGHGDKTLGTVLGAGGGALVGNAIGRSGHHRC